MALVERGGEVCVKHVNNANAAAVRDVLIHNLDRKSGLITDESRLYAELSSEYANHETFTHAVKEYARGDVTTNSVEGFLGIFKRGVRYNHRNYGEQHFQRYPNEFSSHNNNAPNWPSVTLNTLQSPSMGQAASGSHIKRLIQPKTPRQIARANMRWYVRQTA